MTTSNAWPTIEIPSNAGTELVVFRREAVSQHREGQFTIIFEKRGWVYSDGDDALRDIQSMTFNFVELSREFWTELVGSLAHWQRSHAPFANETVSTNHGFRLQVQTRDDLICSTEKPVLTLQLTMGVNLAEVAFVVDQSCLRILEQNAREYLRVVGLV